VKKFFIIFVLMVSALAMTHAEIYVVNHSVSNTYFGGENLSGWINFTFNNIPLNTNFTDTEGNSVSLADFLNKTAINYTCSTQGCLPDLNGSNPETTKVLNLINGTPVILGFKFMGSLDSINEVHFNVTSDAGISDTNQLKIDVLSDGTIDTGNTKVSQETNNIPNYGCYNPSGELVQEATVDTTPYCQKLTLDEAPGFYLGGWIKKTGTGTNGKPLSRRIAGGI
jgi:hypothetical protein